MRRGAHRVPDRARRRPIGLHALPLRDVRAAARLHAGDVPGPPPDDAGRRRSRRVLGWPVAHRDDGAGVSRQLRRLGRSPELRSAGSRRRADGDRHAARAAARRADRGGRAADALPRTRRRFVAHPFLLLQRRPDPPAELTIIARGDATPDMLSLVIPVYKNEANLPRLQRELEQFAGRFGRDLEVVFVVDGSPDGSLRWLPQRLPAWPLRSQLVELSRNFGSFAAIAAGLRQARGDYMAVVTADLQEPLALALEFPRRMAAGEADVVFGYRTGRADAAASSFVSDTFWRLYRRFVVRDMPKGGIDVFGCTRTVRDHLAGLQEVNTNLIALLLWLGFRRAFVGYERQPRLEGRSAWTLGRKIRYALDSVFAFTDLPIRALLLLGVLGTVFAVVAGVTVFIGWLTGHVPVL